MSELKATPGPWERDGLLVYATHHNGDFRLGRPLLVNRFSARVDAYPNQGGTAEEAEANANLIVAAPDLYAACHHAETVMMIVMPRSHSAEYHETFLELKAALAKARGESP